MPRASSVAPSPLPGAPEAGAPEAGSARQLPESLFRAVFDGALNGQALFRLTRPGDASSFEPLAWNPAMARITGLAAQDIVGHPLAEWAPRLLETGWPSRWLESLGTGMAEDQGDLWFNPIQHGHPQPTCFHVRVFPVGPDLVVVAAEDVTARRRLEAELRSHEHFLDTILENIPDMVFVKDARDLRFVRFNRAGEELLGRDRSELIGRNDHDFFPAEQADAFTDRDREVLAGTGVIDIPEEPIQTAGQGLRYLHTRKIAVPGEDGRPRFLLGISEDITARKEAEAQRQRDATELARRAQELARSNQELEQFAYVASHDLQEPLRKIRQFGDMLQEHLGGKLDEQGADYVSRMGSAAQRMQGLVEDLLVLSRVNRQGRTAEPVDLAHSVEEALANLEPRRAASRGEVDVGPLPTILADPVQMVQLFQNLVGNALKFHHPDHPPRVRVRADMRPRGGLELRVEDEGIGFPARHSERILQPFQRLHGRTAYEGTGIGLAICKRIVERHGGQLRAESRPGEGAVFRVLLPARVLVRSGEA